MKLAALVEGQARELLFKLQQQALDAGVDASVEHVTHGQTSKLMTVIDQKFDGAQVVLYPTPDSSRHGGGILLQVLMSSVNAPPLDIGWFPSDEVPWLELKFIMSGVAEFVKEAEFVFKTLPRLKQTAYSKTSGELMMLQKVAYPTTIIGNLDTLLDCGESSSSLARFNVLLNGEAKFHVTIDKQDAQAIFTEVT